MFGGSLKWPGGASIAETTILRFGEAIDNCTLHCNYMHRITFVENEII